LGPEKLFKKKWTIVQPLILFFESQKTFPKFKIHTLPKKQIAVDVWKRDWSFCLVRNTKIGGGVCKFKNPEREGYNLFFSNNSHSRYIPLTAMLFVITSGIVYLIYKDRIYHFCVNKVVECTGRILEKKHFNKVIILSFCNTLTNTLCGIDPYAGLLATIVSATYFPDNTYSQALIHGYKFGSLSGALNNYLLRWFVDCDLIQRYFYGFSFYRWIHRKELQKQQQECLKIRTTEYGEDCILVDKSSSSSSLSLTTTTET